MTTAASKCPVLEGTTRTSVTGWAANQEWWPDALNLRPLGQTDPVDPAFDYAKEVQAVADMPLMVTGGFRTRAGMNAALEAGEADLIGLGRPLCVDVDAPGVSPPLPLELIPPVGPTRS